MSGSTDIEIPQSVLIFQAGPVQSFIAAARSTRDLWSGSYMLSWLVATAAHAAIVAAGADVDAIVFPRLKELGIFAAQLREDSVPIKTRLTPAMPNRFTARVPADKAEAIANAAQKAFRDELKKIADNVWKFLKEKYSADDAWKPRWDAQIALFPEITYQIVPEKDNDYASAYTRCQKILAARRNTRDFAQFVTDNKQEGTPKDILTGKEEIIGDEAFYTRLKSSTQKNEEGPYGAISLCKRVWHEAYLRKLFFPQDPENFWSTVSYQSVPEIAAKNSDSRDNPYIAVIAMDGDKMGQWMSGVRRLAETQNADLNHHHRVFSSRLAAFAYNYTGEIVRKYNGQLIYAGGDDVLAMLPATKAFDCVADLRETFVRVVGKDTSGEIADVSCGIAVANKKYPLQRMIKEAQKAELRAKNDYKRGAFAFSLLKRGGEIVHWGAKWDSGARKLFTAFCDERNQGNGSRISGRFPYALAGLLAPYELEKTVTTDGLDISALLKAELAVVCERQIDDAEMRERIRRLAETYADEVATTRPGDFSKLFLAAAFIFRDREA